ncbi:hypothetical protein TorRG33x02_271390 [Trema orientale]|uniref:Uncharacterized protein n=1 Tax=Trema orientale TaxID=63057 RepID=A0A2P5CW08_TREOI|nr:hypothetical protein TorRG33x02_271390 [Trema orientale]
MAAVYSRNDCMLWECLQWIETPPAQAHTTLFSAKFFGQSLNLGILLLFDSRIPLFLLPETALGVRVKAWLAPLSLPRGFWNLPWRRRRIRPQQWRYPIGSLVSESAFSRCTGRLGRQRFRLSSSGDSC